MKRETMALCCGCGALHLIEPQRDQGEPAGGDDAQRCVVWRSCPTCDSRMRRARTQSETPSDAWCDALESLEEESAEWLASEIDQLRACGVDVLIGDVPQFGPGSPVGMVAKRLDDGSYSVVLDSTASVAAQRELLDRLWGELSTGQTADRWHKLPGGQRPEYAFRLFSCRVRG